MSFAIVPDMKLCTTEQAARAAKISRATLQSWIASVKIDAPEVQLFEGKAVRLWGDADVKHLRALKAEIYGKGRTGRPPKVKGRRPRKDK
jgi:hypothetical protein